MIKKYSLLILSFFPIFSYGFLSSIVFAEVNFNNPEGGGKITIDFNENQTDPVTTIDATGSWEVSFTLIWADKDLFEITWTSSRKLKFKNAPDFENPLDKNQDNIYHIRVSAEDDDSSPVELKIEVTVKDVSESEEDDCFDLLKKYTKVDLSSVEKWEGSSYTIDVSTYDSFTEKTNENPKQNNEDYPNDWNNYFLAKRNNIWTIMAEWDYILTQYVGFWNDTSYDFPLGNSDFEHWDSYWDFKQNIVYTHHLLDWTFVSCGYLKIEPSWGYKLNDLAKENYKTNIFEGSSFEIIKSDIEKDFGRFLVWKVQIAGGSHNDDELFKIKLTTVAYDNESSYFNEFETFPIQVDVMTNSSNQSNGMAWIRDEFLNQVERKTCLELIHPNRTKLPIICGSKYKSLTLNNSNSLFWFLKNLIPYANAKIKAVKNYKQKMEQARWMVIYDGLPYELFLKLEKIPDENFRNWLKVAIVPNYEDTLEHKIKNNQVLSPDEEVFMSCGMDYTSRMEVVKDFLTNLDLEKDINFRELFYLDPKFWDCVVPYPDKRNIDKVIENSFASNKLYAEGLNNTWSLPDPVNSEYVTKLNKLISEQTKLENEYNKKMAEIQKRLDSWEISTDLEKEIDKERITFESKHLENKKKIDSLIKQVNNPVFESDKPDDKIKSQNFPWMSSDPSIGLPWGNKLTYKLWYFNKNTNKNIYFYLIFSCLVFIWIFFLFLWISKKNKKSKLKS